MSRLSQLAVSQRSVTLLLAIALFIAGISAWGSLKQELLPDVDFPVITIVAPYPGAGATDVASQVSEPIERSIQSVPRLTHLQSTSANSIALLVAQFEFGTNVKETQATIEQNLRSLGLPASVDPTVSALNINSSPVIIASIAATDQTDFDAARGSPPTRSCRQCRRLDGVANADLTGTLEPQLQITLDPRDGRGRHHRAAGHRRPAGQQHHPSVGPAACRRRADSRLDHRPPDLGRPDQRLCGTARRRRPARRRTPIRAGHAG